MNVGIVGLGLIGGSIARAVKTKTDHTVFGYDISDSVMYHAKLIEVIDGDLTQDNVSSCEIIILALYPQDTIEYIEKNASFISPGTIVLDTCGIKRSVCESAWQIAEKYGFTFVGGHPMDGVAKLGFLNSSIDMFENASMILVPGKNFDILTMKKLKELLEAMGFGHYEISTPEKHDRIIAYTSQLAHVISSAFVKSPTAAEHYGFSAGSFRDMTRVAYLNEKMWSELFISNRDNLTSEIDGLIERLTQYRDAIDAGDETSLCELLRSGREHKEKIDAAGGDV